jgi:hypothetical protein
VGPLSDCLHRALRTGDVDALDVSAADAADERDQLSALLAIDELWTAPLPSLGGRERLQGHPAIARLKQHLEDELLRQLDGWVDVDLDDLDAVAALRRLARADEAPVYQWLAEEASWEQLVAFVAMEGGPDGGFDDLVATCQAGLQGEPKLTLAANYWDEMGRGRASRVHTTLHVRLVAALELPTLHLDDLPVAALRRSALNGFLATNRWLQPEMVGALGLIELQAGPRCRRVVEALRRLDAPADAFPFYEEHAEADPRHGKAWLDAAVAPLAQDPAWGLRMVRGARWRAEVNRRFFEEAHELLTRPAAPARLGR